MRTVPCESRRSYVEGLMINKSEGTKFEDELQAIFGRNEFWCHLFQQNVRGQPCDLIAAKNRRCLLIDAKDCKRDKFPLSRVEDNQFYSMQRWVMIAKFEAYFAFKLSDGRIKIAPFNKVKLDLQAGVKSYEKEDFEQFSSIEEIL